MNEQKLKSVVSYIEEHIFIQVILFVTTTILLMNVLFLPQVIQSSVAEHNRHIEAMKQQEDHHSEQIADSISLACRYSEDESSAQSCVASVAKLISEAAKN